MTQANAPAVFTKSVTDSRYYHFQWSGYVEFTGLTPETISSAAATVIPSGLTLTSTAVSGTLVQVGVSGGLINTTYTLTCTVTLSDGFTTLSQTGEILVTV